MLLKQIHCQNLLSFGPDSKPLELRPLNILIGPNGSGKSNLIDSISILQAVVGPKILNDLLAEGGGIGEWSWKGCKSNAATISASIRTLIGEFLTHSMTLNCSIFYGGLIREAFEYPYQGSTNAPTKLEVDHSGRVITYANDSRDIDGLDLTELHPGKPIAGQIRHYKAGDFDLSQVAHAYENIAMYRLWSFGRNAPLREPQINKGSSILEEDFSNLAAFLGQLLSNPGFKRSMLNGLTRICSGVSDIVVSPVSNYLEVVFHIDGFRVPASRVSDGTLRFLALLTILCDPDPPGLICLEEPELGMHPDVIPTIADLLKEASQRTQLIVTTHSPMLVDCFNSTPEDIVVCEKHDGQTQMNRLDPEELKHWLEKFSLGELWSQGNIGGNRW